MKYIDQEKKVLALLSEGFSIGEIAVDLGVAKRTVKYAISRMAHRSKVSANKWHVCVRLIYLYHLNAGRLPGWPES